MILYYILTPLAQEATGQLGAQFSFFVVHFCRGFLTRNVSLRLRCWFVGEMFITFAVGAREKERRRRRNGKKNAKVENLNIIILHNDRTI